MYYTFTVQFACLEFTMTQADTLICCFEGCDLYMLCSGNNKLKFTVVNRSGPTVTCQRLFHTYFTAVYKNRRMNTITTKRISNHSMFLKNVYRATKNNLHTNISESFLHHSLVRCNPKFHYMSASRCAKVVWSCFL